VTSGNEVRKTAATNREREHFEDYNYKEPTDAVSKRRSRQKSRNGNNYSSDDSEIDERPPYDDYAHSTIRRRQSYAVEKKPNARSRHSDEDDRIAQKNHRGDRERSCSTVRHSPQITAAMLEGMLLVRVMLNADVLIICKRNFVPNDSGAPSSRERDALQAVEKHQEMSDDIDTPGRGNVVVQPTAVPSRSKALKNQGQTVPVDNNRTNRGMIRMILPTTGRKVSRDHVPVDAAVLTPLEVV
jgi:hypothetical protein